MHPPGNGYALQARFRSGRSIAVHRAAKDAAQVPMLLYGLSGIPIPRLVSSHDPRTAGDVDRRRILCGCMGEGAFLWMRADKCRISKEGERGA